MRELLENYLKLEILIRFKNEVPENHVIYFNIDNKGDVSWRSTDGYDSEIIGNFNLFD